MSLNHYKLYLEQVFQLAETLIIKSEDSAHSINSRIAFLYGESAVHPTDKTSWKYYLNLAGIYHPLDEKIIITSLDTLQPIEFSAANMLIHTATAKAYEFGTRYHRELISQYPDREQFILGVVNPVNLIQATQAKDFSILGYPQKYVEFNEESLIPNINAWLENYRTRWYNKQYNMSDNLHLTALLGIMYQQIVPLILTLRLRACKTSEAHSYHIREYLASNGMLDVYLDYMTRKQALFFYRNINYIERNSGKTENFTWLLDKVLTERDIPVVEINLSQDDEDLLTTYKPKARFSRLPINVSTSIDTSVPAFYTLAELLSKEEKEAPGNAVYTKQNRDVIENKINKTKTNFLKTKVLESKMVDYSDAGLYSIQDIALDHWCHMSVTGQYEAVINFNNKVTNKTIAIPNHIAFLYFIYSYCKVNSIDLKTVPELFVNRIAIDPVPSLMDLKKVVDKKYVSDSDLTYLISLHTPLQTIISTTAFTELINKVYVSYKAEHMFAVLQNDLYKKALIKNASYRLYKAQREVSPFLGQEFEVIFKNIGLPVNGLTTGEWGDVYKELYEKATGLDVSLIENRAAIQNTMIRLFKKLSSYSIQFLSEINKTTIRSINWSAIRMGDIKRYGKDLRHIQLAIFELFSKISHSTDYRLITLKNLLQKFYVTSEIDIGFVDATIDVWQNKPSTRLNININTINPNVDKHAVCTLPMPEGRIEFSNFFDMTEEEKRTVKDVYQDRVTDTDFIPQIDINSISYISKSLKTSYMQSPNDKITGFKHVYVPPTFDLRVDREFTELDAYESNFGTLTSDRSFKPFLGTLTNLLGFKIAPGPTITHAASFKYTGGISTNPGFEFSLNSDNDIDIGDFNFIFGPAVTLNSFTTLFDTRILNFAYNINVPGMKLDDLKVVNMNMIIPKMVYVFDSKTIDTGKLNAGTMQLLFKIDGNKNKINLSFDPQFKPASEIKDYVVQTGAKELGVYKSQTGRQYLEFIHNKGFVDNGNYVMEDFDKKELDSYSATFAKDTVLFNLSTRPGLLDNYIYIKDFKDVNLSFGNYTSDEIPNIKMSTGKVDFGIFNTIYNLDDVGAVTDVYALEQLGEATYDAVAKTIDFI